MNDVEITEICHVLGYQDADGRTLSMVEKLNVTADKLVTKAVSAAIARNLGGKKDPAQSS